MFYPIMLTAEFRHLIPADFHPLHAGCWPERPAHDVEELLARALKRQNQGRVYACVGIVDKGLCAFGMLTFWRTARAEISDLIVQRERRGQGIGSAMIAHLTTIAYQHHVRTLEIGAFSANPRALALYRRLGFRPYNTLKVRTASQPQYIVYLRKMLERLEAS
ncbi:MAG: GNAT family N-acetyltransferase [Chloroflexi bacterium]|nr:GNAT family N-acetyltransferase [Chloroflexota bacterium]